MSNSEMVYRCIGGAQVADDGVCTEHGETACVIGVRVPVAQPAAAHPHADPARERSSASSSTRRS